MGAPMLKKKKELNYRRGYTSRNCGTCDHFFGPAVVLEGKTVKYTGAEGRCKIMGLKPGRAYRILQHYICEAHDGSKRLKRLRGW